jgi:hypothetical protein
MTWWRIPDGIRLTSHSRDIFKLWGRPSTPSHPGKPTGAAHGLLGKDYGGKHAKQEIWKFDGGSISKIIDALKQAAIEEGQWSEKSEAKESVSTDVVRARLNVSRDRGRGGEACRRRGRRQGNSSDV